MLTLNWSAPKETTQGLIPPVPRQIIAIPMKETGLKYQSIIIHLKSSFNFLTVHLFYHYSLLRLLTCWESSWCPGRRCPRPRMRGLPGRWRTWCPRRGWCGTSRRRSRPAPRPADQRRSSRTCKCDRILCWRPQLSENILMVKVFNSKNSQYFLPLCHRLSRIGELSRLLK